MTRASMDGNKIAWSAEDGDLFTLYHGGTYALSLLDRLSECNLQGKCQKKAEQPTLTTPTMIKAGGAIMVWPVDTTFRIKSLVISHDQDSC